VNVLLKYYKRSH